MDEMLVTTFSNGRQQPSPFNSIGKQNAQFVKRKEEKASIAQTPFMSHASNGSGSNRSGSSEAMRNGSPKFRNAYAACNFIVTWDGDDVQEILQAIQCAREYGDRFIQDKLIEYILNIPYRNPRPADIPAFIGKPIWAVDKHGRALVGMPGSESIVDVSALRTQLHSSPTTPSV